MLAGCLIKSRLGSNLLWYVPATLLFCLPAGLFNEAAAQLSNDVCLGCHGNVSFAMPSADGEMRTLYVDKGQFEHSVHGKFLQCVQCHQNATQIPHQNIAKTRLEWRQSIPRMCEACHSNQVQQYLNSVHGRELEQNGNARAAVCSNCHTAHNIEPTVTDSIKLAIIQNCGGCHEANYKSYKDTFHGQVTTLGYAHTAKCFDCHGSHDIQRVNDPASTVYPANRLQTCRKCHVGATAGFATFQPHATTNDFSRYPYTWLASKMMLLLLGGTFAFFWTHSLLWLYREYKDREQHKTRPHVRTDELSLPGQYYQRWSAAWRLAHLVFALSIIVLILTGMTLFYADTGWARAVQNALGGPRVMGVVHRICAVVFVSIFFGHLIYVASRIVRNWHSFRWFGPYSLIPNWQDIKDIFAMFTWFIGRAPRPVFDRWTYWEKFDYWAPFWGVTIIGVSGAMLWFTNLTAQYLPGWVFNVATIFHGEEAFLAAGFLFTVHFFNNHWRPENFPLDIQMFTGAMPLEKFKQDHTLEYNRLVQTGELNNYLVEAPSRPMTLGSKVLGFALMAIGFVLLVLILIGFIDSLKMGH